MANFKFAVNVQNLSTEISDYLTQLAVKVFITNSIGDFSTNKYAENALISFLDLLYDCKLENANNIHKNYPALDLIDRNRKFGVQITSTNSLQKIKDSIEGFFSNKLYRSVDSFDVYILIQREKTYNQKAIDNHIKFCRKCYNVPEDVRFNFSDRNIIDSGTALERINARNDIKYYKTIIQALELQFGKMEMYYDLGEYYDDLQNRYNEIVMNDENNMRLADIYIEPYVTFHNQCVQVEKRADFLDEDVNSSFSNKTVIEFHDYFNNYFLPNTKHEYLVNSKVALILGFPGQGKTSLCKRVMNDFLAKDLNKNLFYFKLKDVPNSHQLVSNPFGTLFESFKENTGKSIDTNLFRNSVLVLDGLDELFMKEGLKLDDIEWFCRALIRDAERIAELQILITSRKHYVNVDKLLSEKIIIAQLAPLSFSSQKKWLNRYKKFHPETWLTTKEIKTKRETFLGEMMEQPILLHIIATLKNDIGSNITRAKLYDRLFTQLIERRYIQDGQIHILKGITVKDLRQLIQEVAFAIYQTGNGYIAGNELLNNKVVQRYLAKFPSNDFKENLKGIMVSFYFNEREIVIKNTGTQNFVVEFLHKSLEEYMVAEKIAYGIIYQLNNKDSHGDYVVNDYAIALKIINHFFGSKPISNEVHEYLNDILSTNSADAKISGERLLSFFNQMLECDFLYEYSCFTSQNPSFISLYSFAAVWSLLRVIFPDRNIVSPEYSQKVFQFILMLENTFPEISYENISSQFFANVDVWGLGSFSYNHLSDVTFFECSLSSASLSGLVLHNCNFLHTSFEGTIKKCDFIKCSFSGTVFDDTNFANVKFIDPMYKDTTFTNCDFKNVSFYEVQKSAFDGVTIDIDTLLTFLRLGVPITLSQLNRVLHNDMLQEPTNSIILEVVGKEFDI